MRNTFVDLDINETSDVNGGGIVGAAAGYVIGNVVGAGLMVVSYYDAKRSGSSNDDAMKAALTVYGGTVITCTVVGGVATGIV
jgi:hypothetical protein